MKLSTPSCLWLAAVAALASGLLAAQPKAAAADYPKSCRQDHPAAARGGGTDVVARAVAQKLTEAWGQQVIVDNRPGANGIIGSEAVAKSKPDGYTLLYGFGSLLSINSSIYKSLPYDTQRDFTPITQTVMNQIALVVNGTCRPGR